nr:hypothetical protein [Tanacetum cinerariifolium]
NEVDELKAERLAKIQDPLALMANSNNPYASPVPHQDLSPFNQNYMQQPMPNPEDITDPTNTMNMALSLMAKAFKLNYSTPTNNNQRISSNPKNKQIAQPGMNMGQDRQMQMIGGNGGNQFRQYVGKNTGNLNGYNAVQNIRNQVAQNPRVQNVGNQNGLIGVQGNGNHNQIGNGNLVVVRAERNACATGEEAPKLKASARKKKGDSASSTTPPTPTPKTIVESAPRLSATAKGKQPARAITPTEPTDVQRTKAEQLKIALKRSRQETYIFQQRGSSTDEGTGSKPGVLDVPSDDSEEELSWNSSDDEEVGGQTKERDECEEGKSQKRT